MTFTSDKSRKKYFAENSYRTNAWNNSEKLKEDIMNDAKRDGLPKGEEKEEKLYLQDDGRVTKEKYAYSQPECNNKIKTSDKRCSKCKNYLDWT